MGSRQASETNLGVRGTNAVTGQERGSLRQILETFSFCHSDGWGWPRGSETPDKKLSQ